MANYLLRHSDDCHDITRVWYEKAFVKGDKMILTGGLGPITLVSVISSGCAACVRAPLCGSAWAEAVKVVLTLRLDGPLLCTWSV